MKIADFRNRILQQMPAGLPEGETKAILREIIFQLCAKWPPYPDAMLVSDADQQKATGWMERLKTGEPLQYITGKVLFSDFELQVNPSVLIPRPETAELPELIRSESGISPGKLIDLGTGSGCLAIALSRLYPEAICEACDISLEALKTASENAILNNARIRFFWQDMNDLEFLDIPKQYDLVVSNPPYISAAESVTMEKGVLAFEPHTALFAPADDPVHYYRRIAAFTKNALNERGEVWLELNPLFADDVSDIFRHIGMKEVRIYPDLSGKDRFLAAFA